MTYPFPDYTHVHISERETGHRWPDGQLDLDGWEDCLFTSAVELHRFAGGEEPASLTESEALRAASGVSPQGPSNMGKLAVGMLKRYGHAFRTGRGEDALMALGPGEAALVAGSLGNFPRGHALRRWDPTYDAGHGLSMFRIDMTERWWWCDPLAPSGYIGQWVSDAQARQFMYGGSLFCTARLGEFAAKEAPSMLPFIDSRAREVDLRAGAVLIDEAGKAVRTLTAQATVVAPFISDATYTAVFASVEGKQVLVRAKRADIVGPVRLTDEVTALISAARIDAAKTAAGADDSEAEMRGRQIEWDRQHITATATIHLAPRPGP